MFGPDFKAGCPSCSAIADGFDGFAIHLAHHDVMLSAVSRAPLAKLAEYKRRMGWTFPWASSFGSDFNADFNVSISERQQREGGFDYNYQPGALDVAAAAGPVAEYARRRRGADAATFMRERPGMSAFALDDGVVYHTYSAYSRGLDGLWGMYQWLDRAPRGATSSASGGVGTTSTRAPERSPDGFAGEKTMSEVLAGAAAGRALRLESVGAVAVGGWLRLAAALRSPHEAGGSRSGFGSGAATRWAGGATRLSRSATTSATKASAPRNAATPGQPPAASAQPPDQPARLEPA